MAEKIVYMCNKFNMTRCTHAKPDGNCQLNECEFLETLEDDINDDIETTIIPS